MNTEAPDEIEALVRAAVDAVRKGGSTGIEAAFESLSPLAAGDVIAELILTVDDLTEGVPERVLLAAVQLPMPPRPQKILKAVRQCSLPRLMVAVRSVRLEKSVASLVVLAAALTDARDRL